MEHRILQRAFGKRAFKVVMPKSNGNATRMNLFSILILLRKIRSDRDALICTLEDIRSFQIAQEEMQQNQKRYMVELKLVAEILRVFKEESLGIVDDAENDFFAIFNMTVKFEA